jgi:galactose mutarotase-like enzyme
MPDNEELLVYPAIYKGDKSMVIENYRMRVEIVPDLGGKLVSLLNKTSGKEWLLDSGRRPFKKPVYGSNFTDWDMSGWDECFPTINACAIRTLANKEISLPDHGEVWSLPWSCEIQGPSIVCSVEGVRLPYRLTRSISFLPTGHIRLAYKADNLGEEPLPFLWTAHPQFSISEPTRILLPDSMQSVLCVYGGKHLLSGGNYDIAAFQTIQPVPTGDGKKFYYPGNVPIGWSGLYGQESGNYLIISVPVETVPYLGIWIDEGSFNDRVTCALEPGIGYYDSLERSENNGTSGIIGPSQSYSWHVDLELGQGSVETAKPS